jgi:hypothetical protein
MRRLRVTYEVPPYPLCMRRLRVTYEVPPYPLHGPAGRTCVAEVPSQGAAAACEISAVQRDALAAADGWCP